MSGDSGEEGERCQGRAELVWEGLGGRFFGARAPWLVHRGRIVRFSVQPPRLSTLCIQALQKKLSLNSAKLSGRLGTSPALLATGASSATFDCAPCGAASTARASGIPLYPRPSLKQ
ncbi:unnamed protein product, partial [Prorocentrum cordatum]